MEKDQWLLDPSGRRVEEGEVRPWEIRNLVLSRGGDIELLIRFIVPSLRNRPVQKYFWAEWLVYPFATARANMLKAKNTSAEAYCASVDLGSIHIKAWARDMQMCHKALFQQHRTLEGNLGTPRLDCGSNTSLCS